MLKKIMIAVALIMSVALTGCTLSINGKEVVNISDGNTRAEKSEVREVIPDGQDELIVSNTVGKINFKAWDGNSIKITSLKKVRTGGSKKKADKMLKDIEINVDKSSESIKVKVHYKNIFGWMNSRKVEMEVLVPEKIKNIKGDTASGEITVNGIKGINDLDLSSASGSISASNSSSEIFKLSTASGSINVSEFNGDGKLKSVSGRIELKNYKGKAEFSSKSGGIYGENIEGKFDSDSVSGSQRFNNASIRADSRFHTISGSIAVDVDKMDSNGQYKLSSVSGSVNLNLPESSQFNLDAKSVSGSINNSFEGTFKSSNHHITGKIGSGGSDIVISTISGSINLNR